MAFEIRNLHFYMTHTSVDKCLAFCQICKIYYFDRVVIFQIIRVLYIFKSNPNTQTNMFNIYTQSVITRNDLIKVNEKKIPLKHFDTQSFLTNTRTSILRFPARFEHFYEWNVSSFVFFNFFFTNLYIVFVKKKKNTESTH